MTRPHPTPVPHPQRIYLRSDFSDYYDHHFEQRMGWPGEVCFERFTTAGDRRNEMWTRLAKMGFAVPMWGPLSKLSESMEPASMVVVHTDPRAHRGEGKELLTLGMACRRYPGVMLAQRFVGTGGKSVRWLFIGGRCWELVYTSNDWRSNYGDVKVNVVGETSVEVGHNCPPLCAVDLVEGDADALYAVDYNIAPGLRGTGMEDVLKPAEVAALIKAGIRGAV